MNLVAYDKIINIDYKKTWINPFYKKLYSYELSKHKYYTFLTRFNPEYKEEELYIVLYDSEQKDIKNYVTDEKHNIKKYRLNDVWKYFAHIDRECNINITLNESQGDCIIYKIDLTPNY